MHMDTEAAEFENSSVVRQGSESDALLGGGDDTKKPFYRPRPLWLVPFAITAATVRGMTIAPRIEVFTQLSCNRLHGHDRYNHTQSLIYDPTVAAQGATSFYLSLDPLGPPLHPHHANRTPYYNLTFANNGSDDEEEDPRRLPSSRCLSDPAVQAGAARIQTIMTTTMGLLSALTTGWWGRFGERHGRTKVLAISTLGLFLTDLTFILVSTPSSPLSSHGHKLLVLAPIIEGLLGGWSTLQSATSAYLSDCTSSGSRAAIFSRFAGVFYFGFSVGPGLGGYLITHPIFTRAEADGVPTVTAVFWVAVFCSFVNFMLVLFVFPESQDKVKRARAAAEHLANASNKGKGRADDLDVIGEGSGSIEEDSSRASRGIIRGFLRPLGVFLPVVVIEGGVKKRRDWSLTFLGAALFGYMLSNGVHQIKYLYAGHVYSWSAQQLSYYISFMGGARASFLLFILPWIIATFKPKPQAEKPEPISDSTSSAADVSLTKAKPKPTRSQLAQAISFDLLLTRFSLLVDILSNTFVTLAPMPSFKVHGLGVEPKGDSQALFVLATYLSSLGSGTFPAIQSLALCVLQVRSLDAGAADAQGTENGKEKSVGELFGALAVLQAMGQMILGPMLFGLIYSGTVAAFPKAIFVTAGGILVCSLMLVMLVRGPTMPRTGSVNGKGKGKGKKKATGGERGRSRASKDLRGGVTGYGSVACSSSS